VRLLDTSAKGRVLVASGVGLGVGVGSAFSPAAIAAPLFGWLCAAGVFVTWTWLDIWPRDAEATAAHALRDDPSRPVADLACLSAAVASFVAVGILLIAAGNAKGTTKLLEIGLAIGAVVAAWALVQTIFTLRYASAYYGLGLGAVDFNQDGPPRYSDFAYIAITIGLTFQVSDTDLRSNLFRRLAAQHMLLSYLMGAVIIAITINLVAGMTNSSVERRDRPIPAVIRVLS
jgi:uncharacterized membrane protein